MLCVDPRSVELKAKLNRQYFIFNAKRIHDKIKTDPSGNIRKKYIKIAPSRIQIHVAEVSCLGI